MYAHPLTNLGKNLARAFVDGQITVRTMMNMCLTADHRVVDGALAAQFLHRVKTLMENPALMLA